MADRLLSIWDKAHLLDAVHQMQSKALLQCSLLKWAAERVASCSMYGVKGTTQLVITRYCCSCPHTLHVFTKRITLTAVARLDCHNQSEWMRRVVP